jgi:DNA-binding helix-hairpin-helix protein with protein kinase domain
MSSPPQRFVDAHGQPVILGAQLGRGGEGSVYTLEGARAGHVAKIYHTPLPAEKQEKLVRMARIATSDLLKITTWPVATLHPAVGGPVRGILMPRLVGYSDVHVLYGPAHRKREFPRADWGFLVQAARNTAAALATLHATGVVVGDINPGNVVVSQQAVVKLIDSDSFQVALDGRVFRCEVGVAHFTPPELQGTPFAAVTRTPNHDAFGLAVLAFLLLFMGRHPFAGRISDGQSDLSLEQAISSLRFAYSATALAHRLLPPPNTLPLQIVPPAMASMFEQAFSDEGMAGGRPTAAAWVSALDELRRGLVVCSQNTMHRYFAGLSACPWCDLELRSGATFFAAPQRPAAEEAIDALWAEIAAMTPTPVAAEPVDVPAVTGKPVPAHLIALPMPERRTMLLEERERRRAAMDAATAARQAFAQRAASAADVTRFLTLRQTLGATHQRAQAVAQRYHAELRRLHRAQRHEQLGDWLEGRYLAEAPVPGLTPTLVMVLAAYGIETAADLTPDRLQKTPGLAAQLREDLLAWRTQVEHSFVFDVPDEPASTAELAVHAAYTEELASLHRQLADGRDALRQEEMHWREDQRRRAAEAQRLALAEAQATADFAAAAKVLSDTPRAPQTTSVPPVVPDPIMREFKQIGLKLILIVVIFGVIQHCNSGNTSRNAPPVDREVTAPATAQARAVNTPTVNPTLLFPLGNIGAMTPPPTRTPTPSPINPGTIPCATTRVVANYAGVPGAPWSLEAATAAQRQGTMVKSTLLHRYGGGGALCRLDPSEDVTVIGRHPAQDSLLVRTALGDIGWVWSETVDLPQPRAALPVVEP